MHICIHTFMETRPGLSSPATEKQSQLQRQTPLTMPEAANQSTSKKNSGKKMLMYDQILCV